MVEAKDGGAGPVDDLHRAVPLHDVGPDGIGLGDDARPGQIAAVDLDAYRVVHLDRFHRPPLV